MTPTTNQQAVENHHYNNNLPNKIMKRENTDDLYTAIGSPLSLKVHRASHGIKKSSYSPTTTSSTRSVSSLVAAGAKAAHTGHQRGPVIIYTHSPKVIHTNPRDFMSLVQKLTGMSRPKDIPVSANPIGHNNMSHDRTSQKALMMMNVSQNENCDDNNNNNKNSSSTSIDDNESSSVITDENCSSGTTGDVVGHLNPCMETAVLYPTPASCQDPWAPDLSCFINNNNALHLLPNTGDSPVYDHMNYNFSYYSQIT